MGRLTGQPCTQLHLEKRCLQTFSSYASSLIGQPCRQSCLGFKCNVFKLFHCFLFCDNRGERATIRLTGETAHRSAEHWNGIRKPAAKTQSMTTSLNLKTCSNRTIHTQCDLRPAPRQEEQSLAIQPRTSSLLRPVLSHHLPHVRQ